MRTLNLGAQLGGSWLYGGWGETKYVNGVQGKQLGVGAN